jgi:hypothetical protein
MPRDPSAHLTVQRIAPKDRPGQTEEQAQIVEQTGCRIPR